MSRYRFHDEFERPRAPSRYQHFGMSFTPHLYMAARIREQSNYDHLESSWRHKSLKDQEMSSTIKQGKRRFRVNIDVEQFYSSRKQIAVKIADGFLVVEAKHGECEAQHGFVSRSFTRRYPLPEGINPDLVVSKLTEDGILIITGLLNVPPGNTKERIVPIVRTGPVGRLESEEQYNNLRFF